MNRVIRGSGLNSGTFESDEHVSPAEVRLVVYTCDGGHTTRARFFAGADEIREQWDCATCRRPAFTDIPDAVPLPPPSRLPAQHKSHWQHLIDRRSISELEELLEERLAVLRASTGSLALVPDLVDSPDDDEIGDHQVPAAARAGDSDDTSDTSDLDEVPA